MAQQRTLQPFILLAGVVCLLFLLAGCGRGDHYDTLPDTLRISVLPDQDIDHARHLAPLFEYLQTRLNTNIEYVPVADYPELVERFSRDEIDLALFGGVTYVLAEQQAGATPIVMRNVDTHFTSVMIAARDSDIDSLADARGHSLAFGSRQSTSGYYMPRYFIEERGIIIDDYFSEVSNTGAHDRTAYAVNQGRADVGVLNAVILDSMIQEGRIDGSTIKTIWETPPYYDYVWGMPDEYSVQVQARIMNAFLDLDISKPAHRTVLERLDAVYYVPARSDNFDKIRVAVDRYR